jgi:hypothetical protein
VVLTNADGTPAVSADVTAATQVPNPASLGAGLLAAAAMPILLGFWLVYLGATRISRRCHHRTTPSRPPAAPPMPVPELARVS